MNTFGDLSLWENHLKRNRQSVRWHGWMQNIENKKEKQMRVFMRLPDQKQFVRSAKMKCNLTWKEIGKLCGVNGNTAKVDYGFRGSTLPLDGALGLSNISGIPLPPHRLLPANWGQIKSAQMTSRKAYLKNPSSYSEELAELLGILMGDGCLYRGYDKEERSEKYFTYISGHSHEFRYYEAVIRPIFKKLFDVQGYFYRRRNQNSLVLVIKSKRIYDFLKSAGMPERTKNTNKKFTIPEWIMKNPNFIKACIRGLTDTDGTVFKSHGRWVNFQYKFASKPLTRSLHRAFVKIGYHPTRVKKNLRFNPKSGKTSVCWQFYLSQHGDVDRFVREIGFSNEWLKEKVQNVS